MGHVDWPKSTADPCAFFFLTAPSTCEILVPQPGTEPGPPALEAWSLNHWTTKEIPRVLSK